jgi:hypothetical protein
MENENENSLTMFTFQELSNYGIKNSQFAQDLPLMYILSQIFKTPSPK